jgi:hypothetical protein
MEAIVTLQQYNAKIVLLASRSAWKKERDSNRVNSMGYIMTHRSRVSYNEDTSEQNEERTNRKAECKEGWTQWSVHHTVCRIGLLITVVWKWRRQSYEVAAWNNNREFWCSRHFILSCIILKHKYLTVFSAGGFNLDEFQLGSHLNILVPSPAFIKLGSLPEFT